MTALQLSREMLPPLFGHNALRWLLLAGEPPEAMMFRRLVKKGCCGSLSLKLLLWSLGRQFLLSVCVNVHMEGGCCSELVVGLEGEVRSVVCGGDGA